MDRQTRRLTSRRWLPWGLALLALILRVYKLRAQSLWVDELFTLQSIRHVLHTDPSYLLRDLHGPLYTIVCALVSGALAGEGLRLVSALAGAFAVIPIHAWARRVAGERVAALTAWLAALSPFAVWYGQELRNYSFVLLLSACAFLVLESWRNRDPGRKALIAFVLCAWLGFLSNQTFILFVLGAAASLLVANAGRRLRTLGWLSLAGALLLLVSLPWVLAFVADMSPQRLVLDMPKWDEAPLRGETTFTPLAIPYTFYTLLAGFSLGPSLSELHWGAGAAVRAHLLVVLPAALFLGALAALGLARSGLRRSLEYATLTLVVLGLASFLAIKNFKVYNVRYVSMLWPMLLLLVARGALGLKRPWADRTLVGGLSLVFALSLGQHYWRPAYAKADTRAAAARLEAEAAPGDLIVVAVVSDSFEHYYSGSGRVESLWPGQDRRQIAAKLTEWGSPSGFWLVSAREWEWGGRQNLLAAFEEYRIAVRDSVNGVGLYKLNKLP